MSRGVHTLPGKGRTQVWLTPPEIIEALGQFDLDPCANETQLEGRGAEHLRTATNLITERGLEAEWAGRVWLNPPYGENHLWLEKLAIHGNGIALLASRTEVERWFVPYVWGEASALLFLHGRLRYYHADGTRADGNAGHGSVLVAYGSKNALALRDSGLAGSFVSIWTNMVSRG